MEFNIIEIFKRSITIEMINDIPYELDYEYEVYINDKKYIKTNKNVVSIYGLEPDTSYNIQISFGEETSKLKTFRTEFEYVLLNVRDFGAVGDGKNQDSISIQAAINSCPKKGTVYIPAGDYICTPIFLKSNMSLWIDKGAKLLGELDRRKYPILPGIISTSDEKGEYNLGSWEGNPLDSFSALITGININNTDIFGEGVVDGRADKSDWWNNHKIKNVAWRPNLLFLHKSENIRVQGLEFKNSPSWTLHPYYSERIKFLNTIIINPEDSPNTDGIDPESCKDVLILGVEISVGDDCIAIKSGKYYMATAHYKKTDIVNIRNCIMKKGHGSVTVGSEIASGVENVYVSKCKFLGTDRGLRIKTRRGRGRKSILSNIVFENIDMVDVSMPFTVNMFYFCDPDGHSPYVQDQMPRKVDEKTPKIGRLVAKNIRCLNVKNSLICCYGLPEMPIEEFEICNIYAKFDENEDIKAIVPLMMDNFPVMVKAGIFIKNVDRLTMQNIKIIGSNDDNVFMENIGTSNNENIIFLR